MQCDYGNQNGQQNTPKYYIYVATMFFRFHGVLEEKNSRVEPHDTYVEQLVEYLVLIRGLAPITVLTARRRVVAFLKWCAKKNLALEAVSMVEIDEYLASKKDKGYMPRSLSSICNALKLFFQFAERQGLNNGRLAIAIRRPRIPRYDRAPSGPEWAGVRRLVEHNFGSTIGALRGDAIVALSSNYALRNSEIARLKVSDFDWLNEIVTVRRAKSRKIQQFPISIEAGEKIIRYLQQARPKCESRWLFVSIRSPYRQLDQATIWTTIAERLKALEIETKHFGTHAIRHACATRLLREGSSLPEIAQFLGHNNLRSVSIYAKHDIETLRQVGDMSLLAVL